MSQVYAYTIKRISSYTSFFLRLAASVVIKDARAPSRCSIFLRVLGHVFSSSNPFPGGARRVNGMRKDIRLSRSGLISCERLAAVVGHGRGAGGLAGSKGDLI